MMDQTDSFTDFYEWAMPQPELFREMAPVPDFLSYINSAQYNFLSAERRDVYATILFFLSARRKAHEIEKYHNDIYDAVQPTIEEITSTDYTLSYFRADIDQLVSWGNVEVRLEPYRLQRISDRRLQKYLYRISDGTRALCESLEQMRPPQEFDRVMLDQDHLIDITEYIERAESLRTRNITDDDEMLRRLSRCFVQIDEKCRLIAMEITEFGARIATFNTSPFHLSALPEIIDWLDRYVEHYLQRVAKESPGLYHRLREWSHGDSRVLLDRAHEATRAHFLSNPLAGPWIDQLRSTDMILNDIVPFFAPEGQFAELCQRVNEQVRALVRKIRQYVDDIRQRNIRVKALRRRTSDVMHQDEAQLDEVRAWLDELIGSGHYMEDAGKGTPSRRAAPPRPTYWRRRVARPPFRGAALKKEKGSLKAKRELEKARLARLSRFVTTGLLKGKENANMHDVTLEQPVDVRNYLDALKAFFIGRHSERRKLEYRIERPDQKSGKVEFEGNEWQFNTPDYELVKKK